ncbi:GlxA family transcriptional regulator [Tropicimonas sediminicola]|uniref:Transcriptional regulator, AraC family with amidase-like domain n=1 Tax=Tropicimonas sediminicola TaxID=1031541 RepID=A0A239D6F1_9RHOB|nr:GlxA family transcriptional regulator [Tropicimonas sediminicola]SNS27849.1 transcriptional regulator, AraC family with amidase-like domain [Tropicimonas sediminicola]
MNDDQGQSEAQAPANARKPILFEFVLLDAFSMLSVISAIEPLRVANRILGREVYEWRLVSEDGDSVQASNGIVAQSEGLVGEGGRPDYTFVCAGLSLVARHPTRLSAFLNRRFAAGVTLGAISMGTIFLARAGLLRNRRCTIHWEGQPAFKEEFPEIDLTRAIYEIDGSIMTCAGGMSSFDLVMELIARDHDQRVLRSIANQLQLDRIRTGGMLQSPGTEHIPDTTPKQLRQAIKLLGDNMEHPMAPAALASSVGASRRTLERLFIKYTGMTPSKYCKMLRLERSRDLLLHSNMPILDVAVATGFRSGSYFSFCFSEYYGISPSSLRQGVVRGKVPGS